MFTFLGTGRPSAAASAGHFRARAILLAGLSLPLLFPHRAQAPIIFGLAAPAMEPLALDSNDRALTQALAEMRYRLDPKDLNRYRRLFAAIGRADWQTADWLTAQIQDRRLVGHALAIRYLESSPGSFAELHGWLDLYGDLPEADAVYRLAQSVRPAGSTEGLPRPRNSKAPSEKPTPDPDTIGSAEPRSRAGDLALSRFFAADDRGALTEAVHAVNGLRQRASTSLWVAGLAAWRLGQFAEAGRYFTALTQSQTASGWMLAAGAYWAGRVDETRGAVAEAEKWFGKASRFRTTFYGMLAMRKLGRDLAHEISAASLTAEHLDILAETPAGYRAVALLEIGRPDLAAMELEQVDPAGNPKIEEALIVVADAAHLGDHSSTLAQRVAAPAGVATMDARFPIPRWQPRGGFRIDPALVFAVVRQESGFDPKAVSPAGATGLMQLMPRTAEMVAGGSLRRPLTDPATNLDLGQRYLSALMEDPAIGGNLLLLALAYNAGSANIAKFSRVLQHDDPLLAIESIPTDETRGFIERVLANYWIYRAKLGGDTSSLTDLANGEWPRYRWDDAANDSALSNVTN
jgi:soluble lytic murein transglycosylase